MDITKHLTGSIIKGENLTPEMQSFTKETPGLWGYATVEQKDVDGDVIDVAGIDTSDYHNPAQGTYLKILASHLKVMPDGSPPVIGRVEQFQRTFTQDNVPALAFQMSWAKDGNGKITDLANKYKELYDGGYLDSFSIGAKSIEREAIKGAGYRHKKTKLLEISCVSLPANQRANVMRSLGEELDKDQFVLDCLEEIQKANIAILANLEAVVETCLTKGFAELTSRFDFLESALVVKSETPKTHDRKGELSKSELQLINSKLQELIKVAG